MMRSDARYFRKISFGEEELERYRQSTLHDLEIARSSPRPEVRFTFAYNALIRAGITLPARVEGVKVRSVSGHHARILQKMGELLGDEELAHIGNAMRTKRNLDFYAGGQVITRKEAKEYYHFVERVVREVEKRVSG